MGVYVARHAWRYVQAKISHPSLLLEPLAPRLSGASSSTVDAIGQVDGMYNSTTGGGKHGGKAARHAAHKAAKENTLRGFCSAAGRVRSHAPQEQAADEAAELEAFDEID